jgi:hypothetical protein
MLRLSANVTAGLVNALLYCAGFVLFLCAVFSLRRMLIPGYLDIVSLVPTAIVALLVLFGVCMWAGDIRRRLGLILLLVAFAAAITAGGSVLIGLALVDWHALATPLAAKAFLVILAGIGCWAWAGRIRVARKVVA